MSYGYSLSPTPDQTDCDDDGSGVDHEPVNLGGDSFSAASYLRSRDLVEETTAASLESVQRPLTAAVVDTKVISVNDRF